MQSSGFCWMKGGNGILILFNADFSYHFSMDKGVRSVEVVTFPIRDYAIGHSLVSALRPQLSGFRGNHAH